MFGVLFTLDYEIHGNGEGAPGQLMVSPTDRMLEQFDRYGAKLTLMADVAEILKFKEHFETTGKDTFDYLKIEEQLKRAVATGHDVQLHIHSSYFKSRLVNGAWQQHWDEYSLADLPYSRVLEMIGTCKAYLESLLTRVDPNYRCHTFRAANWSMSPSENIVRALIEQHIKIDTSVFKYGKRNDRVKFDYTDSYSDLVPWPVDMENVCKRDPDGALVEIPIYSELKNVWAFLTPNRVFRVFQASRHKHAKHRDLEDEPPMSGQKVSKLAGLVSFFKDKHAWKLDFNQCTGTQLIKGLKRINREYGHLEKKLPVVSIGHSKLYTKINEKSLESFLDFIAAGGDKYSFAKFEDFDLKSLKQETVQ